MTEDEAKTKWCFHFTASHTNPRAREWVEGDAEVQTGAFVYACIGSACMAWRRNVAMFDRMTGEPAVPGVAAIGDLEPRYTSRGYCGLAGAPQ